MYVELCAVEADVENPRRRAIRWPALVVATQRLPETLEAATSPTPAALTVRRTFLTGDLLQRAPQAGADLVRPPEALRERAIVEGNKLACDVGRRNGEQGAPGWISEDHGVPLSWRSQHTAAPTAGCITRRSGW